LTGYNCLWIKRKFVELRESFGGKCQIPNCGSIEKLEFAHIKDTELMGRGRGRFERYYDIIHHRDCYALLCQECHHKFDKGDIDLQGNNLDAENEKFWNEAFSINGNKIIRATEGGENPAQN